MIEMTHTLPLWVPILGALVGWGYLVVGILLAEHTRFEHVPNVFAFLMAGAGVGILFIANVGFVERDDIVVLGRVLGYLVFAFIGVWTTVLALRFNETIATVRTTIAVDPPTDVEIDVGTGTGPDTDHESP